MNKIYIPGCKGEGYDVSHELYCALERAKVWFCADPMARIMHIISRNLEAPLTCEEKDELQYVMFVNDCPFVPVFDD